MVALVIVQEKISVGVSGGTSVIAREGGAVASGGTGPCAREGGAGVSGDTGDYAKVVLVQVVALVLVQVAL